MTPMELDRGGATGAYRIAGRSDLNLRRFVGYVRFGEGIEEIDVDALHYEEARTIIVAALAADYEAGGVIADVQEKVGLYF